MKGIQTIAKNLASLTLTRFVTIGLEMVFVIYLARTLGDEALGQYSFANAFSLVLGVCISPGFQLFTVKEVARNKKLAGIFAGNLIIIELILFAIFFSIIVVIINAFDLSSDLKVLIYLFGLWTITRTIAFLLRSVISAFERMEHNTIATTAEKLVTVSMGLGLLLSGCELTIVLSSYPIGGAFGALLSYFMVRKWYVKPIFRVDMQFWKSLPKKALPLSVNGVFMNMYDRVDTLMLTAMASSTATGYYNAAYKLISGLELIPVVVNGAVFPVFSRLFMTSLETFKSLFEMTFKYLFIITLPIAVGVTLLSENIILIVYGHDFSESSTALIILIWMLLFNSLNWLLIAVLQTTDRFFAFGSSVIIFTLFHIISNLFFINWMGYEGAAIATTITAGLLFFLFYYWVVRYLHTNVIFSATIKPIVAATLMGIVLYFLEQHLGIFAVVPICIFVYFSALWALKGISDNDVRLFKQVIKIS